MYPWWAISANRSLISSNHQTSTQGRSTSSSEADFATMWPARIQPRDGVGVMALGIRQSFKILAPGGSLRHRVAYSLLVVRLILAPVIFLAVYYVFAMGRIVDRIVSVDAPATTMSEQVSVEMLEARRAERNYFLLRDPAYLEANRVSIAKTRATLLEIQNLAPSEHPEAQEALDELRLYQPVSLVKTSYGLNLVFVTMLQASV